MFNLLKRNGYIVFLSRQLHALRDNSISVNLYEILKQLNLNFTTTSLINRRFDICIFIKCYKRELFNYHSHVTFEYHNSSTKSYKNDAMDYIRTAQKSVKRFF
jgi:hypothetical protein